MRRPRPTIRVLLGLLAPAAAIGLIAQGGTFALFSDNSTTDRFTLGAGSWVSTTAPAECAGMTFDGDPIVGTEGPDILFGTAGNDLIFGLGGDDLIFGGVGNDCLVGGAGNDYLGGNGSLVLAYWVGPHTPLKDIFAGLFENGNDVLLGEDGNDLMFGGPGTDLLFGGPGNDILGTLSIISGDSLWGESGEDLLIGPWASLVDGGSSLTTPDTEIDLCVFSPPFLPWIPPLPLNNCEGPGAAPLSARSGLMADEPDQQLEDPDGTPDEIKDPAGDEASPDATLPTEDDSSVDEGDAGEETPASEPLISTYPPTDEPPLAGPPADDPPADDPPAGEESESSEPAADAPETDPSEKAEIG